MRKLLISCELRYAAIAPASFIFNIEAARHPNQHIIRESLSVLPEHSITSGLDNNGNRLARINTGPGELTIRYDALVSVDYRAPLGTERELPISDLPLDVIPYLWASRYCESDSISSMAIRTFGQMAPGYQRVEAICQWIRDNIVYQIGTTGPTTTACDVLIDRAGVCRDYAHLAISFCRALNIPARMVTGYTWYPDPPPDFHAIFEAYLEDRWILFDATRLAPLSDVVRIATGKDASETAFATLFGPVKMQYSSPVVTVLEASNFAARASTNGVAITSITNAVNVSSPNNTSSQNVSTLGRTAESNKNTAVAGSNTAAMNGSGNAAMPQEAAGTEKNPLGGSLNEAANSSQGKTPQLSARRG